MCVLTILVYSCLWPCVQVIVPPSGHEYHGSSTRSEEFILNDDDCPLAILMQHPPSQGKTLAWTQHSHWGIESCVRLLVSLDISISNHGHLVDSSKKQACSSDNDANLSIVSCVFKYDYVHWYLCLDADRQISLRMIVTSDNHTHNCSHCRLWLLQLMQWAIIWTH